MPSSLTFWICSAAFGSIGVALLVILFLVRRRFARFAQNAHWVDGSVVATSGDGNGETRIIVEYQDHHGRVRRTTSRSSSTKYPPIGTQTRIVYQPADPGDARIEAELKDTSFFLGLAGLLLACLGLASGVAAFVTSR